MDGQTSFSIFKRVGLSDAQLTGKCVRSNLTRKMKRPNAQLLISDVRTEDIYRNGGKRPGGSEGSNSLRRLQFDGIHKETISLSRNRVPSVFIVLFVYFHEDEKEKF